MFTRSESDHYAMQNAKKYFKLAMKIAKALKQDPPPSAKSCFFLKELIDSYNNVGLLEMDLDNLEGAEKFLLHGLNICDEEEVSQNDDARSRLNHNLGSLYIKLRNWSKAKEHIERDIVICRNIGHAQGEAKGYINLGELHNQVQKYADAELCYQKAQKIASSLEDEDALINQICQNIEIVKKASKVLEDLKKEEQKLKKLERAVTDAKGTSGERKCLLAELACLDSLIEKSFMISAWVKVTMLLELFERFILDFFV
jgi:tetratricopeptide (TPR) repeat protein